MFPANCRAGKNHITSRYSPANIPFLDQWPAGLGSPKPDHRPLEFRPGQSIRFHVQNSTTHRRNPGSGRLIVLRNNSSHSVNQWIHSLRPTPKILRPHSFFTPSSSNCLSISSRTKDRTLDHSSGSIGESKSNAILVTERNL